MRGAASPHPRDPTLTPLPAALRASLEDALRERDAGSIASLRPVGGGCISNVAQLRSTGGANFLLKWSDGSLPLGLFDAEAEGVRAIAATNTLRVPRIIAVHDDPAVAAGPRWLLLEWLEPGRATAETWSRLGRGLAHLHRTRADHAGWPRDNFIGTLPQPNAPLGDWPEFWRRRRLEPQLQRAMEAGAFDRADARRIDALLDALDQLLAPAAEDGHSLLHGDLWGGNLHVLDDGEPALIDPAIAYGHREVDLAMSRLFGGFEPGFYRAYEDAWPLQPGTTRRVAVYQLYYLLVHVNLFGRAYRSGTLATLRAAGF